MPNKPYSKKEKSKNMHKMEGGKMMSNKEMKKTMTKNKRMSSDGSIYV